MPALNFQKQFVMPILTGTKTSKIRKIRKDGRPHCKTGDTLKLFYGMRTKQCELISEVRCTSIDIIVLEVTKFIDHSKPQIMTITGTSVSLGILAQKKIAEMEGFSSISAMKKWFVKHHKIDQHPFTGWHIQWEAL